MAELQRILLTPEKTRPAVSAQCLEPPLQALHGFFSLTFSCRRVSLSRAPFLLSSQLLLAACQLIDTVLAVLPDEFSPFGWMFVPAVEMTHPPRAAASAEFASLLAPLAALGHDEARANGTLLRASTLLHPPPPVGAGRPRRSSTGLLRPSPTGRRRPLLGMRSLAHASGLAPFARRLHAHLTTSALLPRASELDLPAVDMLIGCEFLSPVEAEKQLAPYAPNFRKNPPDAKPRLVCLPWLIEHISGQVLVARVQDDGNKHVGDRESGRGGSSVPHTENTAGGGILPMTMQAPTPPASGLCAVESIK
jgi:hypothetical protein